jgi:hypothetical protein
MRVLYDLQVFTGIAAASAATTSTTTITTTTTTTTNTTITTTTTAAAENCALLGYYAPSNGNFLPTFRDILSVPKPRVKRLFLDSRRW